MRIAYIWAAVCVATSLWFWPERDGQSQTQVRTLRADLAFLFDCSGRADNSIEKSVEGFLQDRGFRVLDKGRLRREHGLSSGVDIVSIDAQQRVMAVRQLPYRGSDGVSRVYSLGLNTTPQTVRATELEAATVAFVSDTLGCRVRQVSRGENGEDARDLHEDQVRLIEGWFRQARDLRSPPI
jgi:hypothetical protein